MAIRKLKIVMSYPVNWSLYKVLRDYVQNFFDAIGVTDFSEKFSYEYNEDKKRLKMSSDGTFDKAWLMYIGATTKNKAGSNYAGKFGGMKLF